MKAFFAEQAAELDLQLKAAAWVGTPFMPNAAVRGSGVSCQKLVGSIYIETGLLSEGFTIPEGPMDWGHANTESLITNFMDKMECFQSIETKDSYQVMVGDMLGFKLGGCVHHCGIVVTKEGRFIHCLRNIGVTVSNLRDASYLKRTERIWRPIRL